jgi:DNA-directed RNA polymerase subunit RPC12/RpoP
MKRPFIAAFILSFAFLISTDSLLASHVSGYTRKDGTYVSGYDRGGSDFGGVDLPSWVIPFLVILAIFVVVTLILAATSKQGKRVSPEAVQQNAVAAERWLTSIQNGTFKPPNTPVLLRENETAILNESCQLMEAKSTRLYGGTGTRIKGIYVGGGASRSFDSLSGIDSGTLTLTNQRVVFTGSMQSRLAELNKIVSLKSFSDAIEIASGKTKSQVYVVANPILWERVIKLIISGHFKIEKVENRKSLANSDVPTIEDAPVEIATNTPKIHYPKLVGSDVHFECKYCGQPIEVNSNAAGEEFQCPGCSKKLVVPFL